MFTCRQADECDFLSGSIVPCSRPQCYFNCKCTAVAHLPLCRYHSISVCNSLVNIPVSPQVGFGKGTPSKTLWVDGIDPNTAEPQLERHMAKHGRVCVHAHWHATNIVVFTVHFDGCFQCVHVQCTCTYMYIYD